MRAVVQRTTKADVKIQSGVTGRLPDEPGAAGNAKAIGSIGRGLVVFLGVRHDDTEKDAEYLAEKIVNLRIFEDENGKMNISLLDIRGQLLVVSQFTLYGDCRKGKRPGFDKAARPEHAALLYEKFIELCKGYGITVESGRFQAMMDVELVNDGPVTLLLDSGKSF